MLTINVIANYDLEIELEGSRHHLRADPFCSLTVLPTQQETIIYAECVWFQFHMCVQ